MCKNYRKQYGFDAISVMPANLYGPGDNFHPENSHVIPAMLRRFHEAKNSGAEEAVIWGAGSAMREFVHVDDAVDASLFLMKNYSDVRHVNIGSGFELSMYDLARTIADTVGFGGTLRTDPSKPDGMPRRILDSSFLAGMGWRPSINFSEGLRETYRWYLEHEAAG
jgi:GDP-L-fucose synthase